MSMTRKVVAEAMQKEHGWDLSEKKEVVKDSLNRFVESKIVDDDNIDTSEQEVTIRKKAGGFQKPVGLSQELAKFMKCETAPRTEVTKQIWVYIKEKNLQNPDDRREIVCDEVLEGLLKKKKIHFMKMTKELSKVN